MALDQSSFDNEPYKKEAKTLKFENITFTLCDSCKVREKNWLGILYFSDEFLLRLPNWCSSWDNCGWNSCCFGPKDMQF